jgi:hypothetical protein
MNTLKMPIKFIVVNHDANMNVQIIFLLQQAIASVREPKIYTGNTCAILGFGDPNVNNNEPVIVKITEISSK